MQETTYIQHPLGEDGAHVGPNFLLEDEVGPGWHVCVLLGKKVTKHTSVIQQRFVSESSLRRRRQRVDLFRAQQSLHFDPIIHSPG